jgi:hypothetical protein
VHADTIFTLGQSGYIGRSNAGEPRLSTHFKDQLPRYRAFGYKPAVFLFNSP